MHTNIIIYDSDCAFCTWCVLFVLRFDTKKKFSFTPLNGKTANDFFTSHTITDTESIWLIAGPAYYDKSGAVLRIVAGCRWYFTPALLGLIVPSPIRDWCYTFISIRRKKLLKNNVCPIIPTEHTERFLS